MNKFSLLGSSKFNIVTKRFFNKEVNEKLEKHVFINGSEFKKLYNGKIFTVSNSPQITDYNSVLIFDEKYIQRNLDDGQMICTVELDEKSGVSMDNSKGSELRVTYPACIGPNYSGELLFRYYAGDLHARLAKAIIDGDGGKADNIAETITLGDFYLEGNPKRPKQGPIDVKKLTKFLGGIHPISWVIEKNDNRMYWTLIYFGVEIPNDLIWPEKKRLMEMIVGYDLD